MDTPASKLPEDSPDTGAPPVVQVPGDSAQLASIRKAIELLGQCSAPDWGDVVGSFDGPALGWVTYKCERGWFAVFEGEEVGDPAQPIPADDEQVWDWTDCPEFGKS